MNPIRSQFVWGPGTSFCYLGLSMAPVGTVDPWVSTTFSIYSWLAWSTCAVTCPRLHSKCLSEGMLSLLSYLSALLVMPHELALHSGLCSKFQNEAKVKSCLPLVLEIMGHNFFSLTISPAFSPFLFIPILYAKPLICWMALLPVPAFKPISGVKFYLKWQKLDSNSFSWHL